ncbi:MAG: 3-dehydroquinate synthase, partial [Woeseiaceae bacterium]
GGLPGESRERLRCLISAAGLPIAPPGVGAARLRQAMKLDKKVQGKALRLVLVHTLGSAEVSSVYSAKRLAAVLRAADG